MAQSSGIALWQASEALFMRQEFQYSHSGGAHDVGFASTEKP